MNAPRTTVTLGPTDYAGGGAARLVDRVTRAEWSARDAVNRQVTAEIARQLNTAGTQGAYLTWNAFVTEIVRRARETDDMGIHLRLVDLVFELAQYRDLSNQENVRPGSTPNPGTSNAAELLCGLRSLEEEVVVCWDDPNNAGMGVRNLRSFVAGLRARRRQRPCQPLEGMWLEGLLSRAAV